MSFFNDVRLLASPWDWFSGSGKDRILSSRLGSPLHGLRAGWTLSKALSPGYQTVKAVRSTRDLIRGDMSPKQFLKSGKADFDEALKHNWPVLAAAAGGAALGGGGAGAGTGPAVGTTTYFGGPASAFPSVTAAAPTWASAPSTFGPGMSLEETVPSFAGATPGINPVANPAVVNPAATSGGGSSMAGKPWWRTPGINPTAGNPPGPFAQPQVGGVGPFADTPTSPGGDARMALAAELLSSSGYSPTPTTNSEALGRALLGATQAKALALEQAQERKEAEQIERLRQAQLDEFERQRALAEGRSGDWSRSNRPPTPIAAPQDGMGPVPSPDYVSPSLYDRSRTAAESAMMRGDPEAALDAARIGQMFDPSRDAYSGRPSMVQQYELSKSQGYQGTLLEFARDWSSASSNGEPLEAVMGPDGKPTLVRRRDAVGATPYRVGDSENPFAFKASDANHFSRAAAELFGGVFDPMTGRITGLNSQAATQAATLSAEAARVFRENEGEISHNEAFERAVERMRGARDGEAPPQAIEYLKKNPHLKDDFKRKYGYLPPGF